MSMNTTTILRKRPAGPIGLDIGARCLKLVQMQRGRDGAAHRVASVCEVPTEFWQDWPRHAQSIVPIVRDALRSGGFTGRQAVGCVPDLMLEYRNMRLPGATTKELQAEIHTQFGDHLGLEPDRFETRFYNGGDIWESDTPRREIIAMAASQSALRDYLGVLRRCGLTPLALDATPGALARTLDTPAAAAPGRDGARLLLDLGHRWTTIIIADSGEVRFVRRIEAGLGSLDIDAAGRLGLQASEVEQNRRQLAHSPASVRPEIARAIAVASQHQAQRFAREIARCLQYYGITFRRGRPGAGFVFGGGGLEAALLRVIADQTDLDLRRFEPPIEASQDASHDSPCMLALATGLALYDETEASEQVAA